MKGKVAIVGSGLIGSSWATLFAKSGYSVVLYDISEEQLQKAKDNVASNLKKLVSQRLLDENLVNTSITAVSSTTILSEALKDAIYVQESTCETVDFKSNIFAQMDALVTDDCILASSTSTIPASKFTESLKHRSSCLVAHPVNPPLYLKLVEIVPAPWTSSEAVERTRTILKDIGQEPVVLCKEVVGFAVNRIQFAILEESWRLVRDGVMSVQDVDKVMSAGLGPRYAFYGPFETIHLNANGVQDYCDRYMNGVRNVIADYGSTPSFKEEEVLQKLSDSLNSTFPIDSLNVSKQEREKKLADLAKIKKD